MNLPVLAAQPAAANNPTPYVILYLIPAAIAAELAIYGWQRRQARAAALFSLMMVAVVFWSACHALSAASPTLPQTLIWAQIQYGGIVLVGPAWLLFALAYNDGAVRLTPARRFMLLAPAALSYAAVLTNGWHHLWWTDVALDTSRPFGSLSITRGLLFWLHYSYSYVCILLGSALLIRAMRTLLPPQRRQARLLAAGALIPLAGNLAHVSGLRTSVVDDPTPFLFAASGLVIFYAALRHRFLDPALVGQDDLIAAMPDGLVLIDHVGRIVAANDLAPELLAAPAGAWGGRRFLGAVAGSPLEIDLRALLALPAPPAARSIAYEPEDGLRAVELRLRPVYSEGGRAGDLLLVRDRTDRARAERDLDQRLRELAAFQQQVQESNGARTTFLASIIHDLRTPLTAIIAFTDMLAREAFGPLPAGVLEPLAHMRRSSQTLLRLVNDMLDFSKIEAGRFSVSLDAVDLAEVIREVAGAMQPLAHERGLALHVEIAADLPPVYADRDRVTQVLTNLIGNAVKFTERGSITVRAALDGGRVRFSVTDTGIGIAPDQQRAVFEEFRQIAGAPSAAPGSGLGLAICRRLMQLMGGGLALASVPGAGSTFTGDLPIASERLRQKEQGGA